MERIERFRHIRLRLRQSIRSMSALIGGSPGLWAQYETGRRFPSYEVLERLSALGVNIDWLIAERGQMFPGDAPHSTASASDGFGQILKALELVLKDHDPQRFDLWSRIALILSRAPDGLTLDELAAQLGCLPTEPRLLAELSVLQQEGVLGYSKTRFRLIRSSYAWDDSSTDLQGLLAVRALLGTMIPAFRAGVGRGKLMRIAETSVSGSTLERLDELVKLIRRLNNEALAQPAPDGSTTLQLVFAFLVSE